MPEKILHILAVSLLLLLIFNSGCAKEYSYEGGNVITDTVNPPNPVAWVCPDCIGKDTQIESKWSFHNDNFFYCGTIDTAIVNPERTGFTFFGPSSCSIDSGMVITVYLDGYVLNKDINNITTQKAGFYYYDNVTPTIMLITRQAIPFTVTIDSYIHQTRMATGTFGGTVYRTNGASSYISSGKFKVKLI